MRPLNRHSIRSELNKYGVRPKKSLGQSFLIDSRIAQRIVDAAEITHDESVLEIGGGLGILTELLVTKAKRVYVVEIDRNLALALTERLGDADELSIIHGDVLKIDLPDVSKVVSNLPFSISSPITFRILRELKPKVSILTYQKEFAQRLIAEPGSKEYSRLTITVNYLAEVEPLFEVPSDSFYPKPAVDSLVVRMIPREIGPKAKDNRVFYWMIRGLYSYPNKQLRRALRIWLKNIGMKREMADDILESVEQVDSKARLRNLTINELVSLSDRITSLIEEGIIPHPEEAKI